MLNSLDLKGGKITYDELSPHINEHLPISEQLIHFTEDLVQIEIGEHFLVDVGFYPEFDPNGEFKIVLIQNYDWETPLFSKSCSSLQILPSMIQEVINCVSK